MQLQTTDISTLINEDIQEEVAQAFEEGSTPMMKLIIERMLRASVTMRASYMIAGLNALDTQDLKLVEAYFEAIKDHVPKVDEQAHEQALHIVFSNLVARVMNHAQKQCDLIAKALQVPEQVETRIYDDLTGQSQPENPTLH